ncbi:MAG: cellulase family glycosylhydrolase [Euryarchaeota archaeon]|nr:cellulase family glycosylhydrolase [Euryarchaeota archaeon]
MRKKVLIPVAVGMACILILAVFIYNEAPVCNSHIEYTLNKNVNGTLGVLIVYMDPGIDHKRAEAVFDAAKDSGATWVRIGFIWAIANPAQGKYNLTEFDWIINAALQRGLSVLPVVMLTPKWASAKPNAEDYYLYPPANPECLEEFGKVIATHFKGRITHWEFWNEPDMRGFLKDPDGDGSTADNYAEMLAYFYRGIKEGAPQAKVLLGGLADSPTEPTCEKNYLQNILNNKKYPAAQNFDILNIHTNFRSPEDIKKQIEQARAILKEHNLTRPLWITETSYTPVERFQILPCYRGEKGFEQYIHDSLVVELNEGADVVFWAALHDYGNDRPDSDPYKYSGLYTYNLEPKPALQVFKNLAEKLKNLSTQGNASRRITAQIPILSDLAIISPTSASAKGIYLMSSHELITCDKGVRKNDNNFKTGFGSQTGRSAHQNPEGNHEKSACGNYKTLTVSGHTRAQGEIFP